LAEGSAFQRSFKGDASEKENHLSTRSYDDRSDLVHYDKLFCTAAGTVGYRATIGRRSACAEQPADISSARHFGQPNPSPPAEWFGDQAAWWFLETRD
jgi:hypothetical protein